MQMLQEAIDDVENVYTVRNFQNFVSYRFLFVPSYLVVPTNEKLKLTADVYDLKSHFFSFCKISIYRFYVEVYLFKFVH